MRDRMTQPAPSASGNRDGLPSPGLAIQVLGGLRLRLDGRDMAGFESDKARALLVYLAWHAGVPIRREVLAALFWGGQPEPLALQNLRKTLHRLRKTLGAAGDLLVTTPQTIECDPRDRIEIDAREFSSLVAQTRSHRHRHSAACRPCLDRLRRAAELYGGELLNGFSPGDCPEFDEWAAAERERLHVEAIEVLQLLAEANLVRADFAQARACARRTLALEPWNEAAHRAVMRALAAEGRRAAALAQFQECVRVLERELGAAPERDTVELSERIRRHADPPAAGAAVARRLPASVSSFVGREQEMQAIADRLQDPDTRLLTLTGAGGSGKTRLAIEAAQEAGRAFADGAFFVPLAPITAPDQIAAAVSQALGLTFSAGVEPRVQLADHMRPLDILLVLDNFEHVSAGAALVGELLRACPRLVVLTTSRERLNVQGERVFAVAPLAAAPARVLFEQRALAAHPEWALTEATAPVVNEICRRLDGLPLALELAAARSHQFGPRELLARLQPGLGDLADGPRDLESRQRTLRAAMDWSYGLLDNREQTLFRRLAPFADGATAGAIDAVCNADGAVGATVEPTVLALANRNLVALEARGAEAGGYRFSLLETVREFARFKLDEADETTAVCAAHFAHYVGLAEESESRLLTAERQSWLARLEAEQHNMRAALDWSFAQDDAAGALRLATALGTWWEVRSQAGTGRAMTERALDRAGSIAPALRAKAWFWLGRIGLRQGALRQSRFELGRGLELYRAVGDERGMASVLNDLGSVAHWMGDYDEAERKLRESLGLRERLSDDWGIAQATNNLGMLCARRGDYVSAQGHFERCLERWQAIGAEMPLAWPLGGKGQVALAQGDLDRGLQLIERSVAIWRKHPFAWALALRLNDLGLAHLLRGSLDAARAAHEESVSLSRHAGDRRGEAFAIEGLARVASADGQTERANELFNLADARLAETGSVLGAFERRLREQYAAPDAAHQRTRLAGV